MRLRLKCKTEKNSFYELYLFRELGNNHKPWILVAGDVSPARGSVADGEPPLFMKRHKRFCGLLEPNSKTFIRAKNALNRSLVESEPIP
jgi:hypothetical protein